MKPQKVGMLPTLEASGILTGPQPTLPSILSHGTATWFGRGEHAIFAAAQIAVPAGAAILAPAFHCPAMIRPITAAKRNVRFYGISPDLGITTDYLERHWHADVRGVLVPHLFGSVGNLHDIRELCRMRGAILIEDCAHAFVGRSDTAGVGSWGDLIIGSPRKLVPIPDGGVLVTRNSVALRAMQFARPGVRDEMRALFRSLEAAVQQGNLSAVARIVRIAQLARGTTRTEGPEDPPTDGRDWAQAGDDTWQFSAPGHCTRISRALFRATFRQSVVDRRRTAWRYLLEKCSAIAHASQYRWAQQADFVPYAFLAMLKDPERDFHRLRASGIEAWRWEHSATGICATTDTLARSLAQIPCHQSLTDSQVEFLANTLLSL